MPSRKVQLTPDLTIPGTDYISISMYTACPFHLLIQILHQFSQRLQMNAKSDFEPCFLPFQHMQYSLILRHPACTLLPLMRPNDLRIKSRQMVIDGALLCLSRFLPCLLSLARKNPPPFHIRLTLASIQVLSCCSSAAHPAVV